MPETPQELAQAVTVALWGASDITNAQLTAQRAVEAIPDGWAKVGGEWVRLEPASVTEWRVVSPQGGISFSANSRDDGRWGITRAQHWLETMRGYGRDDHLEIWEETWGSTPSTWRRLETEAEGRSE
jgi:hypothetical protein